MRLPFPAALVMALVPALACPSRTDVALYVDGFQPKNVRFEVEDLGPQDGAAISALDARPDVDGVLRLPEGSCQGPCRVAIVTVFVNNIDKDSKPEPSPVVRLESPASRPMRFPIAFRGGEISKGRVGRIRWVVELWPEETSLTATLSSSVQLVDPPAPSTPQTTPSKTVTP